MREGKGGIGRKREVKGVERERKVDKRGGRSEGGEGGGRKREVEGVERGK